MANFKRAESEAIKTLSDMQISTAPVDPEAIAEAMGVDVIYAEFQPPFDDQVSGFIRFEPDAQIVVNSKIHPKRKTFTIAHELAHFIMHSEYAKSGEYKVLPRRNSYVGVKPPEEREADAFAANLLVPESMLKAYKGVASVSELATLFAVSEQVIVNRLNHIERCKA